MLFCIEYFVIDISSVSNFLVLNYVNKNKIHFVKYWFCVKYAYK